MGTNKLVAQTCAALMRELGVRVVGSRRTKTSHIRLDLVAPDGAELWVMLPCSPRDDDFALRNTVTYVRRLMKAAATR